MKLSKKGRDRLYGSHNVFYDADIEGDVVALYELSEVWEFEPDDFTGAVILTLDEAKALLRRIPEFKENGDWQLPIERFKERIANVEGKL